MDNLKQLNFLEVAQHFEEQEKTGPSDKIIYMVRTGDYVEWVKAAVLECILNKSNIYNGIDEFIEKNHFEHSIKVVKVSCFRGALNADLEPINATADILNSLYFITDKEN